jgi:hypothetical protein
VDLTRRSLLQLLGITTAAAALPAIAIEADDAEPETLAPPRSTRLEHFLHMHGIKPAHLARESGYSRQHLLRIRYGRLQPSLTCIAALVIAIRRLTRERIKPDQLFEPQVVRSAYHDARWAELEDYQRVEIRAAFGRRTLRELLGAQA